MFIEIRPRTSRFGSENKFSPDNQITVHGHNGSSNRVRLQQSRKRSHST